jgi:hypothetical protein
VTLSAHTTLPQFEAPEPVIDARFSEQEYQQMLAEVREYLPAFLSPAATENHDPVGDVSELMALEPSELDRVMAVHVCLSEAATVFGAALERGMRRPLTSTERPEVLTQAVRGPVDWGATIRRRAQSGWDVSQFAVRPSRRVFDTPENRALAWALGELELAVSRAAGVARASEEQDAAGWVARLAELRAAVRRAQRVEWLREVPAQRPTARVQQRLAATRLSFYRHALGGLVSMLLALADPDEHTLAEVLCQRYFEPHRAWKLFEVLVALRLARELARPEHGLGPRRSRLLAGSDTTVAFARYGLPDRGEMSLTYQGWPAGSGASVRQQTASRHGFHPKPSVPDLFVSRTSATGAIVDAVVLELKATKRGGYLGEGLSQLLGYLGERPQLLGRPPAGWLVAPNSDAFSAALPAPSEPLRVVDADQVASRVAERFLSPAP